MMRLALLALLVQISLPAVFAQTFADGDNGIAQPSHEAVDAADQAMIDQIVESHKRLAEQAEAINILNPIMNPADPQASAPIDVSRLPQNMQWLAELVQKPAVQQRARKLGQVVQEPQFQADAKSIATNPNLKWLYVGSGLVFVVYLMLRRKVLAATDRWWLRLVLKLALAPAFVLGMLLVNYAVLGQPVLNVVWALGSALI